MGAATDAPRRQALRQLAALGLAVAGPRQAAAVVVSPSIEQAAAGALQRLQEPADLAPLWLDAGLRPNDAARLALALLGSAADDGLDPERYGASRLAGQAGALAAAATPAPAAAHALEEALSRALERYLRELHLGRVDPRSLAFGLPPRIDAPDFAALLRSAVTDGRIAEATAALRPTLAPYAALRTQLARYRALAAEPAFDAPKDAATLRPGDRHPLLGALQRQLQRLGDLPQPAAATEVYDDTLVEAVRHFQARHGLLADGVIGRATWAALAVPMARRVRQIELALERLRWLPPADGQRTVAVNIPMFRLWAFGPPPQGAATMSVIVGRALDTRTPVFVDEMRYLVFRPYWNVPRSIVHGEILPALARNPGYLDRQQMEIVRGPGDDATPVAASAANIEALRSGQLRLRQRPGPHNALGLVKFIFPNDASIYLHGTPAPQLFSRARRDFSHGCIRVEDPAALATWALQAQPGWPRERVEAAMAGAANQRVDLALPIKVVLFYVTALALPGEGAPQFADDLYGHDAALERALAAAPPP